MKHSSNVVWGFISCLLLVNFQTWAILRGLKFEIHQWFGVQFGVIIFDALIFGSVILAIAVIAHVKDDEPWL